MKIYICDVVSECVHTGQAEKFACMTTVGIEPATFGMLVQCSTISSSFDISVLRSCFDSVYGVMHTDIEGTRLSCKISHT